MMMLKSREKKSTSQSHPKGHTTDMHDDSLNRHFSPMSAGSNNFMGCHGGCTSPKLTLVVEGGGQDVVMKQKF